MPMALNLIYNSQLYDLLQDFYSHTAVQPPHAPILTTKLMPSEWGAWRYSFNYGLTMEDRQSNPTPDCRSSQDPVNYWKAYYLHRLYINFPDGSRHLLRLYNKSDYQGDGYYAYDPAGLPVCPIDAPLSQ